MAVTGWVLFHPIHDVFVQMLLEHVKRQKDDERNELIVYNDGDMLWRRAPDEHGKGVAKNNEVSDFQRFAARAFFRQNVTGVTKGQTNWSFRECVDKVLGIKDNGWTQLEVERFQQQKKTTNVPVRVHLTLTGIKPEHVAVEYK